MGMQSEIKTALEAHAAWREHFKDILNGRAPFDLKKISSANQCILGKWLENEGHRMIPSELHDKICVVHEEFHQIAADIIQKIKDKRYTEAHKDISLDGPLNQTSVRLRELLVKLSFSEPATKSTSLPDTKGPGDQEAGGILQPPTFSEQSHNE